MNEAAGRARARRLSRRGFLGSALAASAAGALRRPAALAAFDAAAGSGGLRLGYAAITWGGRDDQAIDDIAALGFRGIQLRASAYERYRERQAELRRTLEDKGLSLLCFSSGNVDAVPEREREHLDTHLAHARFVAAVGGRTLQLISTRPKDRAPTPAEFERLGRLLSSIGKRALDLGVSVVYHHHMNGFGEAPDEVARVLELSDRRYLGLLLDIAHYQQGGGDPVAAVSRHRDRLAVVHLKDVESPLPGDARPARQSYRFVELGRGKVDVPGVIAALKQASFNGPALIELDAVTDPARTPRECAEINKQYALETLGLSL